MTLSTLAAQTMTVASSLALAMLVVQDGQAKAIWTLSKAQKIMAQSLVYLQALNTSSVLPLHVAQEVPSLALPLKGQIVLLPTPPL